jgi:hypothetical protein
MTLLGLFALVGNGVTVMIVAIASALICAVTVPR